MPERVCGAAMGCLCRCHSGVAGRHPHGVQTGGPGVCPGAAHGHALPSPLDNKQP